MSTRADDMVCFLVDEIDHRRFYSDRLAFTDSKYVIDLDVSLMMKDRLLVVYDSQNSQIHEINPTGLVLPHYRLIKVAGLKLNSVAV
jgi:hypothetical protein